MLITLSLDAKCGCHTQPNRKCSPQRECYWNPNEPLGPSKFRPAAHHCSHQPQSTPQWRTVSLVRGPHDQLRRSDRIDPTVKSAAGAKIGLRHGKTCARHRKGDTHNKPQGAADPTESFQTHCEDLADRLQISNILIQLSRSPNRHTRRRWKPGPPFVQFAYLSCRASRSSLPGPTAHVQAAAREPPTGVAGHRSAGPTTAQPSPQRSILFDQILNNFLLSVIEPAGQGRRAGVSATRIDSVLRR